MRKKYKDSFGFSVEEKLTSLLSEELSKEIDKQIIKSLMDYIRREKINSILNKIKKSLE